eukprot:3936152-Rhodomonas_salina.1
MQDLLLRLLGTAEGIKVNKVARLGAKKLESRGEGKAASAQSLIRRVCGAEGKAEATRKRAEPIEVCGVPLSLTQACHDSGSQNRPHHRVRSRGLIVPVTVLGTSRGRGTLATVTAWPPGTRGTVTVQVHFNLKLSTLAGGGSPAGPG